MPSFYLFEQQSKDYQEEVLPSYCQKRLAIEMASEFGWHKYAKETLCMHEFGKSGKAEDVIAYFHFDVETIVQKVKKML